MANEQNLKPFKPGNNANPNGRPKKFVSFVLDELTKAGYKNIKRGQVVDIYETLLSLPETEFKKLIEDKDVPMIYRIIGKEMLSKRGFDVIEKMLDRAQGRSTQPLDVDGNVGFRVMIGSVDDRKRNRLDPDKEADRSLEAPKRQED